MAITLVSGSNLANGQINGGNPSITWPTLQAGDVTIVAAIHRTAIANLTESGYTQIASIAGGGGAMNLRVWRKVQGGTPDTTASYNGGGGTSDACVIVGMAFRGVDQTTPEDATPTTHNSASSSPNPPAITTATNGAAVIAIGGSRINDGTTGAVSGYGDYAGTTANDTNPMTGGICWVLKATAGNEDPSSYSTFFSGDAAAVTAALRPATAVASTPHSLMMCYP